MGEKTTITAMFSKRSAITAQFRDYEMKDESPNLFVCVTVLFASDSVVFSTPG